MLHRPVLSVRRSTFTRSLALAAALLACGCGGGGGGSPAQTFVAPTPSPTPAPAGVPALSATVANLTLAGQTAPIGVSEPGYAGAIVSDASGCTNVATVAPASASAPATFTITALGSGSCTIAFADVFGQRVALAVGVTITRGDVH